LRRQFYLFFKNFVIQTTTVTEWLTIIPDESFCHIYKSQLIQSLEGCWGAKMISTGKLGMLNDLGSMMETDMHICSLE
jgi:hypothetical protein